MEIEPLSVVTAPTMVETTVETFLGTRDVTVPMVSEVMARASFSVFVTVVTTSRARTVGEVSKAPARLTSTGISSEVGAARTWAPKVRAVMVMLMNFMMTDSLLKLLRKNCV